MSASPWAKSIRETKQLKVFNKAKSWAVPVSAALRSFNNLALGFERNLFCGGFSAREAQSDQRSKRSDYRPRVDPCLRLRGARRGRDHVFPYDGTRWQTDRVSSRKGRQTHAADPNGLQNSMYGTTAVVWRSVPKGIIGVRTGAAGGGRGKNGRIRSARRARPHRFPVLSGTIQAVAPSPAVPDRPIPSPVPASGPARSRFGRPPPAVPRPVPSPRRPQQSEGDSVGQRDHHRQQRRRRCRHRQSLLAQGSPLPFEQLVGVEPMPQRDHGDQRPRFQRQLRQPPLVPDAVLSPARGIDPDHPRRKNGFIRHDGLPSRRADTPRIRSTQCPYSLSVRPNGLGRTVTIGLRSA